MLNRAKFVLMLNFDYQPINCLKFHLARKHTFFIVFSISHFLKISIIKKEYIYVCSVYFFIFTDGISPLICALPRPLFFPYSTSVLFYIKPGKWMQRKNHPKENTAKGIRAGVAHVIINKPTLTAQACPVLLSCSRLLVYSLTDELIFCL